MSLFRTACEAADRCPVPNGVLAIALHDLTVHPEPKESQVLGWGRMRCLILSTEVTWFLVVQCLSSRKFYFSFVSRLFVIFGASLFSALEAIRGTFAEPSADDEARCAEGCESSL